MMKTEPMVIIRLATARRLGLEDNAGWVIAEPLNYLSEQIQKYIVLHNAETDPIQRSAYAGIIWAYSELFMRMAGIEAIE